MNAQGVEANVRAEPSQIGQKAPLTGQLQPPTGPGSTAKATDRKKHSNSHPIIHPPSGW